MAFRPLYLIGVGGTGAKSLEAVSQLVSAGVLKNMSIKFLYVDADETNGNLERSQNSLTTLEKSQDYCPWMANTVIKRYPTWSPFGRLTGKRTLDSFFSYSNLQANNNQVEPDDRRKLGYLFDVLYTREERLSNLDVGFRGRPAIGSAIMSRIDLKQLSEEPWTTLIRDIQSDAGAGNAPKILLMGSIFGGTGASGLPTIGRLLANKLQVENIRNAQVGAVFFLPYFQFQPSGDVSELYARADLFSLNTESALRYYLNQAEGVFSHIYLLGCPDRSKYDFSTGKQDQKNQAHIVELYGALATEHFLNTTAASSTEPQVVLMSRGDKEKITWSDIPNSGSVQSDFAQAVRFAYLWLDNFYPALEEARGQKPGQFAASEPWFSRFFKTGFLSPLAPLDEQQMIYAKVVQNWCQQFWYWLYGVHSNSGENHQIALFRCPAPSKLGKGIKGELLPSLVAGRMTTTADQAADNIQSIKLELQRYQSKEGGMAEFIKTLYNASALSRR